MSCCILMTVLMSETIEGLGNNFLRWKVAFESKGLKVNGGETEVLVSGSLQRMACKDGNSVAHVWFAA